MKRFAPILIVAFVALLTVGTASVMLRANRRAAALRAATLSSAPQSAEVVEPTHALGPPDAPVVLEEYGDFQCPACAATSATIREIKSEFGDRLRLIFWQFPLAMHRHAKAAAIAAEAASMQGHFWEMHDLLFKNQNTWIQAPDVRTEFEKYALELELNMTRIHLDMRDPVVAAKVDADREKGTERGVKNTPTLFINGEEFPPPFDAARLREAINAVLAKKASH